MDRLAASVTGRGIPILARIDHAAAAAEVGMELRPTEVLIFGNPRAGTPLMQTAQTIGIDLPLKVLVWEDETNQTWLAYSDPAWLARRHGIDLGAVGTIGAMAILLASVAKEATSSADRPAEVRARD
jgi:uncharacterized protein (DUF302 family)